MRTVYPTTTQPPAPPMLTKIVDGPRAWTRATIHESDWNLAIPDDCLRELAQVMATQRYNPIPTLLLQADEFSLSACRQLMTSVRTRLDQGPGVVVLDRLPVEDYSLQEMTDCFWLLGSLLARPVVQTIQGDAIIHVTDTGIKKAIGVRGFRTNVAQPAHVDNSFNHTPPDYVSLCSLRKAVEGGISRFVSFYSVHNALLQHHPDVLPRLYRPFYQDRQGDFWPGEPQTVFFPVFELNPDLRCRYTQFTIPAGYQTAGVAMDVAGQVAFDTMSETIQDPDLYCEFMIEPGQLQFVNNRFCGHGRTTYQDHPNPNQKRYLLRLWHRDWGRRSYRG